MHAYMLSTPGCWAAYGQLLAREYENPALFASAHRLTVDAYALQHPGINTDRRAIQSIWVHYSALHLALEDGLANKAIRSDMQQLAGRPFPVLPPPPKNFEWSHSDVLAGPVERHVDLVRQWAKSAYDAWEALREPTRRMLEQL